MGRLLSEKELKRLNGRHARNGTAACLMNYYNPDVSLRERTLMDYPVDGERSE
jgi:hypothetical protein